jgi:hypothetical protein
MMEGDCVRNFHERDPRNNFLFKLPHSFRGGQGMAAQTRTLSFCTLITSKKFGMCHQSSERQPVRFHSQRHGYIPCLQRLWLVLWAAYAGTVPRPHHQIDNQLPEAVLSRRRNSMTALRCGTRLDNHTPTLLPYHTAPTPSLQSTKQMQRLCCVRMSCEAPTIRVPRLFPVIEMRGVTLIHAALASAW